jgi:hypothetical protein
MTAALLVMQQLFRDREVHMYRLSVPYSVARGIQSRHRRELWVQAHEYRDDLALGTGFHELVYRSK